VSEEVWNIVLFVALALTSYSFSVLLGFSPIVGKSGPSAYVKTADVRIRRTILVLMTAAAGVLTVASTMGWEEWPAGLLCGVAVVELGPFVFVKTKAMISRLVSAFRPKGK